jgi:hypothetical protein
MPPGEGEEVFTTVGAVADAPIVKELRGVFLVSVRGDGVSEESLKCWVSDGHNQNQARSKVEVVELAPALNQAGTGALLLSDSPPLAVVAEAVVEGGAVGVFGDQPLLFVLIGAVSREATRDQLRLPVRVKLSAIESNGDTAATA